VAGAPPAQRWHWLFAVLTLALLTNQYATDSHWALFGAGLSAFLGQSLQGESLATRGADGIPDCATFRYSVPRCLRSIGSSTSRCCWSLRSLVPEPHARRAVLRAGGGVAGGGATPWRSGATHTDDGTGFWRRPVPVSRARSCRSSTRRCGPRAWWPGAAGLRLRCRVRHLATGARAVGAYLCQWRRLLQFHLQGRGVDVPSQLLAMTPYLATIIVPCAGSRAIRAGMAQHAGSLARHSPLTLSAASDACNEESHVQGTRATGAVRNAGIPSRLHQAGRCGSSRSSLTHLAGSAQAPRRPPTRCPRGTRLRRRRPSSHLSSARLLPVHRFRAFARTHRRVRQRWHVWGSSDVRPGPSS